MLHGISTKKISSRQFATKNALKRTHKCTSIHVQDVLVISIVQAVCLLQLNISYDYNRLTYIFTGIALYAYVGHPCVCQLSLPSLTGSANEDQLRLEGQRHAGMVHSIRG